MIKDNIEVIDLQGQLERLVDNYRKLREKDGQGKLITWSNHLLYEMYPGLIETKGKILRYVAGSCHWHQSRSENENR
jgi:hypothetical protein